MIKSKLIKTINKTTIKLKTMKTNLLIVIMLLIFGATNAQIGEIKVKNGYAMIYDENGKFTQKSINLGKSDVVSGYNSKYIIITKNGHAMIHDQTGRFTQKSISLYGDAYVKMVTNTAILIVKNGYTMYYDFEGKYTQKSTRN